MAEQTVRDLLQKIQDMSSDTSDLNDNKRRLKVINNLAVDASNKFDDFINNLKDVIKQGGR